MNKSCSIIIPCYKTNFEILDNYIGDINNFWNIKYINLEIILIIDDEPKNTNEILKKFSNLKNKYKNIKVLLNNKNLGQHKSVLNGFDFANSDIYLTLDDDYKYPVNELPNLVKNFIDGDFDCIIGKPKKNTQSFLRKFATYFIKNLFNYIYFKKNKIHFSSFRLIKKRVVKNILKKNYISPVIGFLILNETKKVKNFIYEKNKYSLKSRYSFANLLKNFFIYNFFYTNIFYRFIFFKNFKSLELKNYKEIN